MNYIRNGERMDENTFYNSLKQDIMREDANGDYTVFPKSEYEEAVTLLKSGNTVFVGRDDEDFNKYFIA